MNIVETLMAPGVFELELKPGASGAVRAQIEAAIGSYDATDESWAPRLDGYVVVFNAPPTVPTFEQASYTGVLLDFDNGRYIGEGLPALMNQTNGIGVIADAPEVFAAQSLSAWMNDLFVEGGTNFYVRNGLFHTSTSNVGLSTYGTTWQIGQGLRELLYEVCRGVGDAEYRVYPNFDIAAGPAGSLFRSGEVLFTPSPSVEFAGVRQVSGQIAGYEIKGSDTAYSVLVAGAGQGEQIETAVATHTATVGLTWQGLTSDRRALVDAVSATGSAVATVAAQQLGRRRRMRDSYQVVTDDPHVRWSVDVGDTVYVHDAVNGIVGGDPLLTADGVVYPQTKRVQSLSGPVPPSASVWLFRSEPGGDGLWVDLSDTIVRSTGATTLTVGEGVGSVESASDGSSAWLGSPSTLDNWVAAGRSVADTRAAGGFG